MTGLTRDEIVKSCIDRYFIALNEKNLDVAIGNMTENCRMLIPSSGLVYPDRASIHTHFEDFVGTFATINFHDFKTSADTEKLTAGCYFKVSLIDDDGEETVMTNANFFELDENGLIRDIIIIATQPLDKGFQAGRV